MSNRHYFIKYFTILFLSLLAMLFISATKASPNIAFYYGTAPPIDKLRWFDVVVVNPNNAFDPKAYHSNQNNAFAYVSLGEVSKDDPNIPKNWILAKNSAWHTSIADESNHEYQKYILKDKIAKLWQQGYRGFFLDTLDSYQLAAKDKAERERQIAGLIAIIKAIKQDYPDAKLILNRGFELIQKIPHLVYAVAAESLFAGWNQREHRYVNVPETERTELLTQLNQVKKMGIPVIVIDYLPETEKAQVKNLVDKINQLGFIPWITNKDLTNLNFMSPPSVARKVLIIADSNIANYVFDYDALAYLAMPLQYLGYVPLFHDIKNPLPAVDLTDVASIIVWLNRDHPERKDAFYAWLMENKNKHIPILFFNRFGFDLNNRNLAPLGLTIKNNVNNTHWINISYQAPEVGYEAQPLAKPEDFVPIHLEQGQSLLQMTDLVGNKGDMVGITPWGGYILYPFVILDITRDQTRWIINPFRFLQKAMKLPMMPVPDTTTENGRRIMFVHIDGDGIANKGEWLHGPYAGKVLLDEIFTQYKVPTSVSVIEGEIGPNGMYPKDSKALEAVVKEIFRLPWIEIASHTFSHPYNWQPNALDPEELKNKKLEAFNLNIPNYRFNLKDEIIGSVNYINSLAPPDKKCKALFWSGDANPPLAALEMTYQIGVKNINGGDSDISAYNDSITHVGPLGLYQGPYFQTFAAIQNDYIYTDEWTPPFYKYIRVIGAFKLTDSPLRLKPIDIYYHMYAGSKLASLSALKKVYDWALAQPVINFFATDYINKVQDFNSMAIAQQKQGWIIRTAGKLRELRITKQAGYPDLIKSKNVIGYSEHGDDYYLHLGPATESYVQLAVSPPTIPYLESANGIVNQFARTQQGLNIALSSYVPLKLSMGNMKSCWMEKGGKIIKPSAIQNDINHYDSLGETQYVFTIKCK